MYNKKLNQVRFLRLRKDSYSDEELLELFKKTQKSEYFDQLYERYIPLVYGVCLKYLQDTNKAQDAVIDIFEYISERISGYEIKIFKNWLYSVTKNHCFQVLKENKKEIIVNFDSQIMESDDIINLFDDDISLEKENALNECIEKLPAPQALSIRLFFLENKSYADIVDETGYHLKSVKSYIQNGKRNLKICIEKNLRI